MCGYLAIAFTTHHFQRFLLRFPDTDVSRVTLPPSSRKPPLLIGPDTRSSPRVKRCHGNGDNAAAVTGTLAHMVAGSIATALLVRKR